MKILLPRTFRERLRAVVCSAGSREVGGVLMAEQLNPGEFRLDDFSTDDRTGTAAHFVRSVDEHSAALGDYFGRTGAKYDRYNYLGEWHSHPNHPPIPSTTDIRSMFSLVNGERDIPFALLLIVKELNDGMACSATLFRQRRRPEPVAVETVE